MFDLYVYYKVRERDAARLEPMVRAMQRRLALEQRVATQLKRRPQAAAGVQTWMEVYLATGASFAETLSRAARDAGLESLIEGPRRTEVFTDLTPCA
jgi:hypothetical protein